MTTEIDDHLEAEVLKLFPEAQDFWVGANDADCLTLNFVLNGHDTELWQTEDNMGDCEAENFVFRNVDTDEEITFPFPQES